MVRYYASRDELTHEDMIVDFLRRLPGDGRWADVDMLEREEVIPHGTREEYEVALQRLVEAGRVRTSTR